MISKKEFLEEFEKRFSGFCENAPIHIEYAIGEISLNIRFYDLNGEELDYCFEYDFFKSVKENIFDIHLYVQKHYPVVCKKEVFEEDLTVEEIAALVDSGMDADEAMHEKNKRIISTYYIVDKVLLNQNTLVLIDKANKKNKYRMRLKKPASVVIASFSKQPAEDWNKLKAVEKKWEPIENV